MQVVLLKVCLHLNQPGWERTLLVVATDDTDRSLEKMRRYYKDGLVSKSPKQTGSRAVFLSSSLWLINSLLCTGSIVMEALIMMRINQSINHVFQDYFIAYYCQITVGRLTK